jgi:hypothetical protein
MYRRAPPGDFRRCGADLAEGPREEVEGVGLPSPTLPVGAGEPPDQGHEAVASFEKGQDGNCDGYPRRAEEDRDADDQRGSGHEEQEREPDHRGLDFLFAASAANITNRWIRSPASFAALSDTMVGVNATMGCDVVDSRPDRFSPGSRWRRRASERDAVGTGHGLVVIGGGLCVGRDDGQRHGCSSSGEDSVARQSRQIRGSRVSLNEPSAERESSESAASSMSDSRRPAVQAVSRGVVKNRSRNDSSVSSLPSVRSTACWLIPHLPQTSGAGEVQPSESCLLFLLLAWRLASVSAYPPTARSSLIKTVLPVEGSLVIPYSVFPERTSVAPRPCEP